MSLVRSSVGVVSLNYFTEGTFCEQTHVDLVNISSTNTEYFAIASLDCELPDIPDVAVSARVFRLGREV